MKIIRELGWSPSVKFEVGIRRTIQWYLENSNWIDDVRSGVYRDWIKKNYQEIIPQ